MYVLFYFMNHPIKGMKGDGPDMIQFETEEAAIQFAVDRLHESEIIMPCGGGWCFAENPNDVYETAEEAYYEWQGGLAPLEFLHVYEAVPVAEYVKSVKDEQPALQSRQSASRSMQGQTADCRDRVV